ncbi:MAG: hypothetical protein HY996_07605 [Micrococcales bacterium]|nr:hypothetical protein [Micrococcales bacterium]
MTDDARARPDLFKWNGRMDQTELESWLASNKWIGSCPRDLLKFWQETGGGDVFETETILGPLGDPPMGDDLAAVNREMRERGMPERFLVFHVGLLTTAVDTASGDYVELTPELFRVVRRFASLEEWYRATLRAEYGQRYGLR